MEDCRLVNSAVFGPVNSRSLGSTLGINILPSDVKVCNFNCVYCECGWTDLKSISKAKFPTLFHIRKHLEENLKELRLIDQLPDSIIFSGNGEPTLHPYFPEIMDEVIKLRNIYSPGSRIVVFTNGTLLNRNEIVQSLRKADQRIVKLDAGLQDEFTSISQPLVKRSVEWVRDHLKYFNSKLAIQTLFLKGYHNGKFIDNTSKASVDAWLECVDDIRPELVILNSFTRPTSANHLEVVEADILYEIAEKVEELGIKTQVKH